MAAVMAIPTPKDGEPPVVSPGERIREPAADDWRDWKPGFEIGPGGKLRTKDYAPAVPEKQRTP